MGILENLSQDKELKVLYTCKGCGVQVIIDHNFLEKEGRSIGLECLWTGCCKPCYERSWAEHPDNPANVCSEDESDGDEEQD